MSTLATRLGHAPTTRLVVITCDDLGLTHSSNVGVYDSLRHGLATSASLLVPAPWSRHAAGRYRGEDVGVHLALNAEWDTLRWGPITHAPSLLDGDGGFPRTLVDLWDHADPDEVRKECRAQIERAIWWGFDVSHLDSHLGALWGRPELFDVYLGLAVDFALPVRLPPASEERRLGFPLRALASAAGVVFPDDFVYCRGDGRRTMERVLFDLGPGVTELHLHPAVDTAELRAACGDWPRRVEDHAYACRDSSLADLLDRAGAVRIGYRALRDAQRGR
ncbi:MAG: polysaccharide deacetylase family protein [Acidimicrobiia bacterium]